MTDAAPPPTPAHLFLACWGVLAALAPHQRSAAQKTTHGFIETARGMAALDDAAHAVQGLQALMDAKTVSERRGRMLGIMIAIDMVFAMIHPRSPRAPTRRALRPPAWLLALQDQRIAEGHFIADAGLALIPRGPLLRTARDVHASSADTLADRFTYLCAVKTSLDDHGSAITVSLRCIGMDLLNGVEPVAMPGAERIAFIPLAEAADDLDIHAVDRGGNPHAFYGPAATLPCAERFLDALDTLGEQDLAVAPELVMREADAGFIQTRLLQTKASPRLLLLGTGHSAECHEGQAYNEALLVNSVGTELWRQRKLWPASLDTAFACQLGLCGVGAHGHIPEDNAASRQVELVDIDGFGRLLVLICQDLKLTALDPLIEASQPDWILLPILADNLDVGRWAHRRALAISENAQSRFVGVTSRTLAMHYNTPSTTIGFALGPAQLAGDEEPLAMDRAAMFIAADLGAIPAKGTTIWHGAGWIQSTVGAYAGVPADDP